MARMFGNHELADLIANFRQEDVVGMSPPRCRRPHVVALRGSFANAGRAVWSVSALPGLPAARPFGSPQQQAYHYDDDPSVGYIPPKPPAGYRGIYPAPPDAPARRKVFAPMPPPLPPLPPTEDQQAYVCLRAELAWAFGELSTAWRAGLACCAAS